MVQSIPRDFGNYFPVPAVGRFPGLQLFQIPPPSQIASVAYVNVKAVFIAAYSDEIAQALNLFPFSRAVS